MGVRCVVWRLAGGLLLALSARARQPAARPRWLPGTKLVRSLMVAALPEARSEPRA